MSSAPSGRIALVFLEGASMDAARAALAAAGGYEIKAGERTLMAAFADAGAAAAYAMNAQKGDGVRAGLHVGTPIRETDAATGRIDYFGPDVNLAARLCGAAHPGQTLLSEAARDAAGGALAGAAVTDLGEHRLRGIEAPCRVVQALRQARTFPPLLTVQSLPTNLPQQTTSFVGRERELEELARLIVKNRARLVTITGAAGIGKTRLAVRLAAMLLPRFEGGCWYADVAEAKSADDVAAAAAEALGLAPQGGPVEAVAAALEMRRPCLVVLDTVDGAVERLEETLGMWMARAPRSVFVVTSRRATDLAGEREYRVEPLPIPATGASAEEMRACDAVRLFGERAREARPDFELGDAALRDVAAVCADLEGIPLAIELAASRTRILAPSQILKKLETKFELLRSPRQDSARRQHTLAAAIEWSVEQLADWERAAFLQASAFRGGFFPEAADAVLDLAAFPGAPGGAEAARALHARSLLAHEDTPYGLRFREYRPVREYAERLRLADASMGKAVGRHEAWVLAEAERWLGRICSPRGAEARGRILLERENLLSVAHRGGEAGGRAVAAFAEGVGTRWPAGDMAARLETALLSPSLPGPLRARLLTLHSEALRVTGTWDASQARSAEAVSCARASGGGLVLVRALRQSGYVHACRRDFEKARRNVDEAESLARAGGDRAELAHVLALQAQFEIDADQHVKAEPKIEEAEALYRSLGDRAGTGMVLLLRGELLDASLQYRQAVEAYRAAGVECLEANDQPGYARALLRTGVALLVHGSLEEAVEVFQRVEAHVREAGRRPALAVAMVRRGRALSLLRREAEAEEALRGAEQILRQIGETYVLAEVLLIRGELRARRGDFAEALALSDEAEGLAVSRATPADRAADIRARRAKVLLAQGRAAEARAILEDSVRALAATGTAPPVVLFHWRAALADARERAGDPAGARQIVAELVTALPALRNSYSDRSPYLAEALPVLARLAPESKA